jgi:hypothetical protein
MTFAVSHPPINLSVDQRRLRAARGKLRVKPPQPLSSITTNPAAAGFVPSGEPIIEATSKPFQCSKPSLPVINIEVPAMHSGVHQTSHPLQPTPFAFNPAAEQHFLLLNAANPRSSFVAHSHTPRAPHTPARVSPSLHAYMYNARRDKQLLSLPINQFRCKTSTSPRYILKSLLSIA